MAAGRVVAGREKIPGTARSFVAGGCGSSLGRGHSTAAAVRSWRKRHTIGLRLQGIRGRPRGAPEWGLELRVSDLANAPSVVANALRSRVGSRNRRGTAG